jgi:hypothetical protein
MKDLGRKWTEEDLNFLKNNLGMISLSAIATRLNRTRDAVTMKTYRLGIGKTKHFVGMLTIGELANLLKVERNTVKCWVDRHGLDCIKKTTRYNKKFYFINAEKFWSWAKENQSKLDFLKIELNSIPPEPSWVKDARLSNPFRKKNYKPWTTQENRMLVDLIQNGLSYKEVGERLGRTLYSIEKQYKRLLGQIDKKLN